jgi:hypothetical protein
LLFKDVYEYFEDIEAVWRRRALTAEPIGPGAIFEYVPRPGRPPWSAGLVFARIRFPLHPRAYLKVDELVVSGRRSIRRERYAYELVHGGLSVANWHRDPRHGDHHHIRGGPPGTERRAPARIEHRDMIDACLRLLWEEREPDLSG